MIAASPILLGICHYGIQKLPEEFVKANILLSQGWVMPVYARHTIKQKQGVMKKVVIETKYTVVAISILASGIFAIQLLGVVIELAG